VLHAVIATHGPETCPAANETSRQIASKGLATLIDEQDRLGISIVGGWANMPGHALYVIVDAPNAHVINEALVALGFHRWSTVDVSPVVELARLQEALASPK
jgi:hypothetical protein